MKVAYSTATINYLPRACTLAHSFLDHHPGYRFLLFLIDPEDARIDPFRRKGLEFISIQKLNLDILPQLLRELDISEICFSLKPLLAEYILDRYPETEHLFYFDGDIRVYAPLYEAEQMIETNDLLLTPHFTNPVNDNKTPSELDVLRTGLYNMGFAGFRNSENTKKILAWWKSRVLNFGYENHDLGLTADQMWMSLAPLFFDHVAIIRHPGYNFAYWNVHERELYKKNDQRYVNERLVFVHFADFDPDVPQHFSDPKHFNRIQPGESPALHRLCKEYAQELKNNHFDSYKAIPSMYAVSHSKRAWQKLVTGGARKSGLKHSLIWLINLLHAGLRRVMRKISLFILRNIK